MATATFAQTNAQRANLLEGLTNQIIEENVKTREANKRGAIKYNKNVDSVSETLKLDYQTNTWKTWAGLEPYTASEQTETIVASYTTGQYYDTISVRPDKLERIKNDKNKVYDIMEEAMGEVRGRARVQLETELNQGDGSTHNNGTGTSIVGYRTAVPDTTTSLTLNGIAVSSHSNYRPQVFSANGGPSGDWDADHAWIIGAMASKLSFSTNAATIKPTLAFVSRDLANTLGEELWSKYQPMTVKDMDDGGFNYSNQLVRGPGGIPMMMDDGVASNTMEFWNFNPEAFQIWTPYKNSVFTIEEHSGEGRYVGSPPIFELRCCMCVQWRQPRAFGKLTNANAGASVTLL